MTERGGYNPNEDVLNWAIRKTLEHAEASNNALTRTIVEDLQLRVNKYSKDFSKFSVPTMGEVFPDEPDEKDTKDTIEEYSWDGSPLHFNLSTGIVRINDREIGLTQREAEIFTVLCENANSWLTNKIIYEKIYGSKSYCDDGSLVRAHLFNMKNKIEENPDKPRFLFSSYTYPKIGGRHLRGYILVTNPDMIDITQPNVEER